MQTYAAKRIEITIEAPLLRRLTRALDEAKAPGYTVLPVLGGSGKSGPWSREGQVGSAGGMACVMLLVDAARADELLTKAFAILAPHIGVVSITDCHVVRPERFE